MRSRYVFSITFVLSFMLCALIAWLGGYNFDHRGREAAALMSVGLIFSTATASLAMIFFYQD